MRNIFKRIFVLFLSFLIAFNLISSDYQCSKVEAAAATISLLDLLYATAASIGIPLATGVGGAVIAKNLEDAFISYVTGTDSKDIDTWTRASNGIAGGVALTAGMVDDVKGWLETFGIDVKSGSVVEKTVSIPTGEGLVWFDNPMLNFTSVKKSSDGTKWLYDGISCFDLSFGESEPLTYALGLVTSGNSKLYLITKTKLTNGAYTDKQRYMYVSDLGTEIDARDYISTKINQSKYFQGTYSWYYTNYGLVCTYNRYYIYEAGGDSNWSNLTIDKFVSNVSGIPQYESLDAIKSILSEGSVTSDITIPSIGTYDENNITELTDGRTLSAADLQAIADAINNPYADYKNSDGAITQEDLQAAVTAAIAAALAAAGEKEEPDNPTDDSVITAGFQGVFDWFQKVFDLMKTFFATATTFVTTFPLKLWRDSLETFPVTLANIQDAVGDVFGVGEQIAESLTTFPTAESLKDLITGVPADLTNLKDAVSVFPKAFQDAMTGVITDVFPAALIGALEDALPSYIVAGVTALPLQLVDILIPQLDLSIPRALEGSLPKILTDALAGSIVLPEIKVDLPAIEIPNYMDILGQILAAILAIPALLTFDVPAIKAAAQAATKDVALETGLEPIVTLFEGIRFDDNITYPVIAIDTPDILKKFYQEPQIILLDFEDYAQYCEMARNIFRVTLWLAFLYWAAKQLQVHYHIG